MSEKAEGMTLAKSKIQEEAVVKFGAMSTQDVIAQVAFIQEIMKSVMREGEHYGTIPGTDKPTLYKPGAEKLAMTFQFAPKYPTIERIDHPNGHREYEIECHLFSIESGLFLGAGVGNCSTLETKYRYRHQNRICPECNKEAVIKGKEEYGGGWLCFKKKDGCGAKFNEDDPAIVDQPVGRVEHDNPADYWNTVKKMSKKRAYVDAVLTRTAASDIFTQDLEDMAGKLEKKSDGNETETKPPKPLDESPQTIETTPRTKETGSPTTDAHNRKVLTGIVQGFFPNDTDNQKLLVAVFSSHRDEAGQIVWGKNSIKGLKGEELRSVVELASGVDAEAAKELLKFDCYQDWAKDKQDEMPF